MINIVYIEVAHDALRCKYCDMITTIKEYSLNIFKTLDDQKNNKKNIVFHFKEIFRKLKIIISIKSKNTLLTVVCSTTHSPGYHHS